MSPENTALPPAFITCTSGYPDYYVTIKTETLKGAQTWHGAVLALSAPALPSAREERLAKAPSYQQIIDIVNDCAKRMQKAGESHAMLAKWISEGLNAALASPAVAEEQTEEETTPQQRIENAMQAMSETHSSWESRCHAIMASLGIDYGRIGEFLPDEDRALASPAVAEEAEPVAHPDDLAVDRFAAAMKSKLAKKRSEGRGGWEDKEQCSTEFLSGLLLDHVAKGDPVDVGNLAMMLHQRGERIAHPSSTPAAAVIEAARNLMPYLRWTTEPESPGHHPTMPSAVAALEHALVNAKQEGK